MAFTSSDAQGCSYQIIKLDVLTFISFHMKNLALLSGKYIFNAWLDLVGTDFRAIQAPCYLTKGPLSVCLRQKALRKKICTRTYFSYCPLMVS